MSDYQEVKVTQSFLRSGKGPHPRPPWFVIAFAIFYLVYALNGFR